MTSILGQLKFLLSLEEKVLTALTQVGHLLGLDVLE
jgi:hypothetical protein